MTIGFKCSNCDKKYSVKDELAGRRYTCKACGLAQRIPTPKKKSSQSYAAETYDDGGDDDFEDFDDYGSDDSGDDDYGDYDGGHGGGDEFRDSFDDYAPSRSRRRSRSKKRRRGGDVGAVVKVPGVFLMIMGGLVVVFSLLAVVGSILIMAGALNAQNVRGADALPLQLGAVVTVIALFWVMMGCLEFYGGLKMFQGRSWGMALAGAIVLMIPVVGGPSIHYCCLLLTMPIGIWATVVLCIE